MKKPPLIARGGELIAKKVQLFTETWNLARVMEVKPFRLAFVGNDHVRAVVRMNDGRAEIAVGAVPHVLRFEFLVEFVVHVL